MTTQYRYVIIYFFQRPRNLKILDISTAMTVTGFRRARIISVYACVLTRTRDSYFATRLMTGVLDSSREHLK